MKGIWIIILLVLLGIFVCGMTNSRQCAVGTYQMAVYTTGISSWIAVMDTRTSEVRIEKAAPCKLF